MKDTPLDRERVIWYDMKDGDYAAEIDPPLIEDPLRDRANREERELSDDVEDEDEDRNEEPSTPAWATGLNKVTNAQDGMMWLADKYAHIYYLHGSRIEPMLVKRIGIPEPKLYTLDDFTMPKLSLELPTVLYGLTGCGKTEFALAHFDHPLVVRRRDDLKRVRGVTDGIIFDDMAFDDWTPEDTICLLEKEKPRSLPARYSDAFVDAGIPMIFTTNKKPRKLFTRARDRGQRAAIKRRYEAVEVTGSLAVLGRPLTAAEKRARREAGAQGPRGPGPDAVEAQMFG